MIKTFLFFGALFGAWLAHAAPTSFVYQGQIIKTSGSPVTGSVTFTVQILSPGTEKCVLYEENHTVNMTNSEGIFTLPVGTGARSGTHFENTSDLVSVFKNNTNYNGLHVCFDGSSTSYGPTSLNDRRRLRVSYNDGSGPVTLPSDHNIQSVPYAWDAKTIDGMGTGSFLQVNSLENVTQNNLEDLLTGTNFNSLMLLAAGTSPKYVRMSPTGAAVPALTTDPTTPTPGSFWFNTTTKKMMYFDTAAREVGSGGGGGGGPLVEADIPTLSTAGKVVGSAIVSGTIGGTTAINTSGAITTTSAVTAGSISSGAASTKILDIYDSDNTQHIRIQTPATSLLTTNYTLTLPENDGNTGEVLTTDGSGTLSWTAASGDISSVTAGTGLVGGGASGAVTLAIDYGTGANQVTQNMDIPHCASNQKLQMSLGTTYIWSCVTDNDSGGDITAVNTTAPLSGGNTTGAISLALNYDNTSVGVNGSDQLEVKGGGITAVKLATDSVITAKIQDGAITDIKLATDSVTTAKIVDGAVTDVKILSLSVDKISSDAGKYFTYKPNNSACADGGVLKWDGTAEQWKCGLDIDSNTTAVSSVFTRTGAITAQAGDYTAAQITNTPAGDVAAVTVQAAITELDDEKVSKAGDTMTGALIIEDDLTVNAQKDLRLGDSDSTNYVGFRAPATVGTNVVWTLPAVDGNPGEVLSTSGTGTLSWTAASAGDITAVSTTAPLAGGNTSGPISLSLAYDNASVGINGSSQLEVKTSGITAAKLATDAVETLKIKNGAVTDEKIASVGVGKITSGAGQYLTYMPNNVECTDGYVLKWTAADRWECAPDSGGAGDITSVSAGTGLTGGGTTGDVTLSIDYGSAANQVIQNMDIPHCAANQKLEMSLGTTYAWSCVNEAVTIATNIADTDGNTKIQVEETTNEDKIRFDTAGTERMIIDSNGRVGIGNNSPDTILEVGGTIKIADGGESCTTGAHGGMIRYNGNNLQYCDGTDWQTLGVSTAAVNSLAVTAPLSGTATTGSITLSVNYDNSSVGLNGSSQLEVKTSGISAAKLATDAVETLKIKDGAVTDDKITSVAVDKITSASAKYFKYMPNNVECAAGGVLKWNATADQWECGTDTDTNTDAITSVFTRTGAITAQAGDYTAAQITNTPAGTIAATTAQAAITELDTEKVAKTGDVMSGALTMNAQNDVRFADSDSSHYVAFRAPATVGTNVTWTLPATDGAAGDVLSTNSSGTLSWFTPATGDITAVSTTAPLAGGNTAGAISLTLAYDNTSVGINGSNQLEVKALGITDGKIAGMAVDKLTNASGKYFKYMPNNVECAAGGVLKWNATADQWECGTDSDSGGDITSVTAGAGLAGGGTTGDITLSMDYGSGSNQVIQNMDIPHCAANQKLEMSLGTTYVWSCVNEATPVLLSDADGDTRIQVEASTDEDKIRFDTAGTERMIIDGTGVGIGTSAPAANLHIEKAVDGDTSIRIINPDNVGANARAFIMVGSAATGANYGYLAHKGSGSTKPDETLLFGADTNGLRLFGGGTGIRFESSAGEAMRIDAASNIGINAAVPTAKLHIVGTSGTTLRIVDGNQAANRVLTSDANGVASWQDPVGGGGGGGTVTGVTATAPVQSSGGTAPVISMAPATALANGYLTSGDWTTFSSKAPTASPTFTGTPISTTAAVNTNTTQIATTAFVLGQASSANPLMNGTVASGTGTTFSRADHVHPVDTSRAPAAGSTSITTLGTVTTGTWNASVIPVLYGGTGTSTGSITGTGALTFAAGGTNQNVTLTPSGTGDTILNGDVGIGTSSPTRKLDVVGAMRADSLLLTDLDGAPLTMNSTSGTVSMDDAGQKRISWNDGAGHLNLRLGNRFNGTNTVHLKGAADANGGAATLSLNGDAAVGSFYVGVSAVGVPGATVNYSNAISLTDGYGFAVSTSAGTAAERFRIDTAGNVGIGVTPTTKLHIVGTSGATLRIVDGNQAVNRVLTSDANGVASWAAPATNGTVTGVTATAPVQSSGGTAPVISMAAATSLANGYLTSGDWTTFNNKAPTASPTFTGVPLSTTAAVNTNTTQIATTAFVLGQASSANPLMNGTVAPGTGTTFSRTDHVHPVDTSRAPAAGSTSVTTLGTVTTGTWNASVIPVLYGGTGTSTGSITGTGALTFAAGGTNQSITLTPTGTGDIILNGNVGIGAITNPPQPLTISTATASAGFQLSGTNKWAAVYTNLVAGGYNGLSVAGDEGLFYGGTAIDTGTPGFVIGPWTAGSKGIRMDANGNVGVGVTPTTKLHISGTSGTTLRIVDGNQAANRVLTSDANGVASWAAPATSGTVTGVTATAPVQSSGGTAPVISMAAATSLANGYLTSGDWTTFNNKAPTASPTFTGVPLSTTAAVNTNTTQIATTAFVLGQASSTNPLMNGTVAPGTGTTFSRTDHVHPVDTSRAPAAGSTSITTLGTVTTGTWNASVIPVLYGGTGTNNGSITGTGALTFTAGGTNQNITLTPSGTGDTILNGDVGIGTTTPLGKVSITKTVSGGEGATLVLQNNVASGVNSSVALYFAPNTGGGNDIVRAAAIKSRQSTAGNYADLGFFTSASTTPTESMTILAAGNVGINATAPTTKLHIVGTSGTTLRIVDGNQAANRVLTSDANGVASWAAPATSGTVTGVTATAPVSSSGGTAPVISMAPATALANGYLTSGDWTTFTSKAPTASPTFTGTPLSTTAAVNTNTTQIATTAFVLGQASSANPLMNGTVAPGTGTTFSRADHVHPVDTSRAPASGSASITTLGTIATGVWNGTIIGILYGGTGTNNGSITGSGALTFTAGGTNQNVTLTPSGTGYTLLNGKVGLGIATPGAKLEVAGAITNLTGTMGIDACEVSGSGTAFTTQVDVGDTIVVGAVTYTVASIVSNTSMYVTPCTAAAAGSVATKSTSNDYLFKAGPITVTGGNVGIGIAAPAQKLSVSGIIESTVGGVKYPDGQVQLRAASVPSRVTTITASGTYTPLAGAVAIEFEAVGGGGGSGGADGQGANTCAVSMPGSGGGYARKFSAAVVGTYTVTIGAAGTAGAATGGNGGAGGNTTVVGTNVNITAGGGAGGAGMLGVGTNLKTGGTEGGTATGGDVNVRGGTSGPRIIIGGACYFSGVGGDSNFGRGGTSDLNSNQAVVGGAPSGYGGGGGASSSENIAGNAAGQAGAAGVVIVREWRPQ